MYTRRLRLETLYNCRDLGGYPVEGGRTKFGVFLRSEMPINLSENDEKKLRDYGIKMSLDFRSTREADRTRSNFRDADWVEFHHMPTFPENADNPTDPNNWNVDTRKEGFNWGDAYIQIAELSKAWAKKSIEYAAECDGVLHYHCFTGKDRTGIFSCYLLGIAGVSTEDIAADYCLSQSLLDPFYADKVLNFDRENRDNNKSNLFLFTSPTNMFKFIAYLEKEYGGIVGYLKHCGVSEETIETIRNKFIEKED